MLFFLGNSHANNGIAPVELWNQYGYTAYNFSMMSQTFPLVYYNAVDAIKMQHPDILVVDLFAATSFSNNFPNMHKSIDNLTLTTRLTAISEFIPDDLKMEYYFPMYLYHDRWSNLEKKDESHVNILGALKVTDFLGKFISENYNITDYRDNVKVAKEWNDAYMKYSAQRDGLVAKCNAGTEMNTLSLTFLCAYLLVLLIYWIIPDRYRNIFLLICSLMYMTLKYGKPYNITYIGRLEHIKGVNLLIGAFAAVCLEHDVRLSIVGDGTERDKLEALVRSLNIEDKVTFYGQQVDIHPYLSDASIFVYPSTCEEVFGISIIEAMAYGLPCVANNVGGIPEIIKDEENGFLTKEPTKEQIALLIKKVIGMYESGEIDTVSHNAKDTAQRFSVVNTCRSIEGELDNTN